MNSISTNDLFGYAAAYADEADARSDLEAFQELASVGVVGKYDTALLTPKYNFFYNFRGMTPPIHYTNGGL
jgi:hypothetical protein